MLEHRTHCPGRTGVRAKTPFRAGQFVCEFELTREEYEVAEREYKQQNMTVYTLEVYKDSQLLESR